LGLGVAGFIRALQTDQPGQSGRVGPLQPQRRIRRIVPLLFTLSSAAVPSSFVPTIALRARGGAIGASVGIFAAPASALPA
jgi:hypothetical protein